MLAELSERLTNSHEAPGCPSTTDSNQRRSLAVPCNENKALESATPTGDEIQDDVIPEAEVQERDQNEDKENIEEVDKDDDVKQSLELYTKLE